MKSIVCGFIGLGLIGGSIAKSIKKTDSANVILAYDINADVLAQSLSDHVVDIAYDKLNHESLSALGGCDILFLCAPVHKNDENLLLLKKYIQPNCILTDVGSVKSSIHETIKKLELESNFVGGHPMAGSEKFGYANATPMLLENAFYVLTKTENTPDIFCDKLKELVHSMHAIPLIMEPDKHDYVTAGISHLPHIIASSLVNLIKEQDDDEGLMKLIAAGGFKDITRIASSSPAMWQQICASNGEHILEHLTAYIDYLTSIKDAMASEKEQNLFEFFADAKEYRDSFANTSSGPLKKAHEIYVDLPDKTGALAMTATILAFHDISIKNIGIMHNREFQEGALHIAFYDESSLENAIVLLDKNNYTIYKR